MSKWRLPGPTSSCSPIPPAFRALRGIRGVRHQPLDFFPLIPTKERGPGNSPGPRLFNLVSLDPPPNSAPFATPLCLPLGPSRLSNRSEMPRCRRSGYGYIPRTRNASATRSTATTSAAVRRLVPCSSDASITLLKLRVIIDSSRSSTSSLSQNRC